MTDTLRERVIQILANFRQSPGVTQETAAEVVIALIRAETLEEAARVVRRMPSPSSDWIADELLRALGGHVNPVPAIRALKDKP